MKLTKKAIIAAVLFVFMIGLAGCGSNNGGNAADTKKQEETAKTTDSQKQEKTAKAPDQVGGVSLENPIKVDKEAGTVTVLAQVNGKYFTETTRHASVFKDGSNGAKSVFTAYGNQMDFYDALVEIGAEPGNNMTPDNAATTHVEGTPIEMKVTWNGADKEYNVNDVIKDSNGNKIAFKFGGNHDRALEKNTGCISCLDSCPVGIISNSTYTNGAVENSKEVKFTGNQDVLPEDGTYVATVYSIAK
ncbi:YdjY domain-containing protein [Bacillus benzoevorans]|uniref:Ferredoxin n=1 Tax=Bacillus benzoevorans TaxID=1456 RepID=A0A7X0LWP3_9BACI|nr:YdjY domain-containing protein [Bacillus benzoevorans]MBB6445589.1 ferredoxin [Bacillus benzoevorans]